MEMRQISRVGLRVALGVALSAIVIGSSVASANGNIDFTSTHDRTGPASDNRAFLRVDHNNRFTWLSNAMSRFSQDIVGNSGDNLIRFNNQAGGLSTGGSMVVGSVEQEANSIGIAIGPVGPSNVTTNTSTDMSGPGSFNTHDAAITEVNGNDVVFRAEVTSRTVSRLNSGGNRVDSNTAVNGDLRTGNLDHRHTERSTTNQGAADVNLPSLNSDISATANNSNTGPNTSNLHNIAITQNTSYGQRNEGFTSTELSSTLISGGNENTNNGITGSTITGQANFQYDVELDNN